MSLGVRKYMIIFKIYINNYRKMVNIYRGIYFYKKETSKKLNSESDINVQIKENVMLKTKN